MKIDGIHTTNTKATDKKKKPSASSSASGGVFASLLSGSSETSDAAATSHTHETIAPSDINPMLSMQEVSDDEVDKKKAVKQGRQTLDMLEELRHQLLIGSVPTNMLKQMEKVVQQQRQYCTDPRLESVLNDIEVRAAVELAKLEMATRQ